MGSRSLGQAGGDLMLSSYVVLRVQGVLQIAIT